MNISKKLKGVVAACVAAVGMTAVAEQEGVQLWDGSPIWATCNVGDGATKPEDYGAFYSFADAASAAATLGDGWRLPTKDELDALLSNCDSSWTTQGGVNGFLLTSKSDSSKSIFLPAAGYNMQDKGNKGAGTTGKYWSSSEMNVGDGVWGVSISTSPITEIEVVGLNSSMNFSVRAVKDAPPVDPSVKIDSVTAGEPWSTITVNYTLSGTNAKKAYKVAFDVTAGGLTAGVTNEAAKLENKAYSKEIDTAAAAIFGKQVADAKAKVKVSLIETAGPAKPSFNGEAVQLWEGAKVAWADRNLGATTVGEYGDYYDYFEAMELAAQLGDGWRLPTKAELDDLEANYWGKFVTDYNGTGINGVTVAKKSASEPPLFFLPAAGCMDSNNVFRSVGVHCEYWSSTTDKDEWSDGSWSAAHLLRWWNDENAYARLFVSKDGPYMKASVRLVRDVE